MARKANPTGKNHQGKEFAVIGLGRFGASLARRLEAMGHIILGVDDDMARVQAIADDITSAVALDATNEDALAEVDIAAFSTVIVALSEDFEASALITSHLKALGIGRIICLAKSRRHRDILLRIGADQVILPEEDSGERLAETLAAPNMLERVLLDTDHSLTELKVPPSLVAQPLSSLLRYGVDVVLIQRPDRLIPNPGPETRMERNDTIFVIGEREKLIEISSLT